MTKTDIKRRLGFEDQRGDVVLLDAYEIFYVEVVGHDSVIRTARRKTLRSSARLSRLAKRLPRPPFLASLLRPSAVAARAKPCYIPGLAGQRKTCDLRSG